MKIANTTANDNTIDGNIIPFSELDIICNFLLTNERMLAKQIDMPFHVGYGPHATILREGGYLLESQAGSRLGVSKNVFKDQFRWLRVC